MKGNSSLRASSSLPFSLLKKKKKVFSFLNIQLRGCCLNPACFGDRQVVLGRRRGTGTEGRRVRCGRWAVWMLESLARRGPMEAGQMAVPGARTGSPTPSAQPPLLLQGAPSGAWPGPPMNGRHLRQQVSSAAQTWTSGRDPGKLVAGLAAEWHLVAFIDHEGGFRSCLVLAPAGSTCQFIGPPALCLSFVLPSHPCCLLTRLPVGAPGDYRAGSWGHVKAPGFGFSWSWVQTLTPELTSCFFCSI